MPETVMLNGQSRPWRPATLHAFLTEAGVDPARPGIAVAVNARVVPRAAWDKTDVRPDDRVEIVQARAGG